MREIRSAISSSASSMIAWSAANVIRRSPRRANQDRTSGGFKSTRTRGPPAHPEENARSAHLGAVAASKVGERRRLVGEDRRAYTGGIEHPPHLKAADGAVHQDR